MKKITSLSCAMLLAGAIATPFPAAAMAADAPPPPKAESDAPVPAAKPVATKPESVGVARTDVVTITLEPDQSGPAAAASDPVNAEVVFVLDTTGSMGGLIEGAKQKIWSIATDIQKTGGGKVKMGLIAYRDRGDQYVTKRTDLTDDLDTIYGILQSFKADGGGDTPESVNQALNEAVTQFQWSDKPDTMKTIFLVGDCPPHMDYQDDVKYPESCKLAVGRHIVINTVQCGSQSSTVPIWREIANLSAGDYAAIAQSGNMRVTTTPYDVRIAETSRKLDATVIPYGSKAAQKAVTSKLERAAAAAPASAAMRNAYKMSVAKEADVAFAVTGKGDLVQDASNPEVLKNLKPAELPEKLQSATPEDLKKIIAEKAAERSSLNQELAKLNTQRADYLREEAKKNAPVEDSFDARVRKSIARQLQNQREQATLK